MEYIVLVIGIITCILSIVILILNFKSKKTGDLSLGEKDLNRIEKTINEKFNSFTNIVSNAISSKNESLMNTLKQSIDDLKRSQSEIIEKINTFSKDFMKEASLEKEQIMGKLSTEMRTFNDDLKQALNEFNNSIKEKLEDFKKNTNESLEQLKNTVQTNLIDIRKENSEKLDEINKSVNSKLQETLETKLRESFNSVVQGIGDVNKAVGEIKGIATDVGSLKNVLTNVKTKGILGEVMLKNILDDFLTAGQYEENVITKKSSNNRVEFAIKLPGNKDDTIYLPVDSKFPYKTYSVICNSTDIEEIRTARKELSTELLNYAKDVNDKYIDAPNTTDFAIIFLPLEGLYLEALNMGLFEEIQRKYKVNLTGPTTFTAFVSALNMGFKSLMIQKKSSEVFKLLSSVKTEFGKFADELERAKKKVNDAADELEKLAGTRTRQMNRQLNKIETFDETEIKQVV